MTEVEKMRSSRLADMAVPEIQERFAHANWCPGYLRHRLSVRLSIAIMEMESNWASTFLSMPIVHF